MVGQSGHGKSGNPAGPAVRDARFVRRVLLAFLCAFLLYAGFKAYHIYTAFAVWDAQSEIPVPDDRRLMPAK